MASQSHRGPDGQGLYSDPAGPAGLAHNRLSIIDLSSAGKQPMASPDGRYIIVFNGEIYNYIELRAELRDYAWSSRTDTEVILAAYQRWGESCLDRFVGMFAFLIWDAQESKLFAARDRFGVKPLNYTFQDDGTLLASSEIVALHAAGVPASPDPATWATYLACGLHDHTERTFWKGIRSLPPGHFLTWRQGRLRLHCWYDLAARVGPDFDQRPVDDVREEYLSLLLDSVKLRFRSDVPVGINLSGGLDSSTLLGLVNATDGRDSRVEAFTYVTGDPRYDELPWVNQMLARTRHPSVVKLLAPEDVPQLAQSVQSHQSEPFGGLPTLAYARLFERARENGVIVVMDGQGMDEQWAGYDYYAACGNGSGNAPLQGTVEKPVRPECLTPDFHAMSRPFEPPRPFPDALRNRQYLDTRYTKIPRALRFNDRISMRVAMELREPFLDHRLFEVAFRQPRDRKIVNGTRKWLLRDIARQLLPDGVVDAPKRPLQTPQREWLRGPLRLWAHSLIQHALRCYGGSWLDSAAVEREWREYCECRSDNSFYIWQWISLGLMCKN